MEGDEGVDRIVDRWIDGKHAVVATKVTPLTIQRLTLLLLLA